MPVTVLTHFKRILSCVGLGSEPIVVLNRTLSNLAIRFFCLLAYFMVYAPLIVYVFDQRYSLSYINSALYLAISASLILTVYIDYIRMDLLIHQTLQHLERLIIKSE